MPVYFQGIISALRLAAEFMLISALVFYRRNLKAGVRADKTDGKCR
jgi:hypothetical protein